MLSQGKIIIAGSKKKIARSTPLDSSRAGCRSYQRIYLPFPSVAHLSSPPFYLLSFHSQPTYLTCSSLFPSPSDFRLPASLPPSFFLSFCLIFTSIFLIIIVGLRTSLFLSLAHTPPITFLSYKHMRAYI